MLALSPSVTVHFFFPPLGFPICISFCINIAYLFLVRCLMYGKLLLKTLSSIFFIFKFLARSLFLYIEGIFLFLYLSLYVAIFKFPAYTALPHFCPSCYDIVYTDLFSTLVSYLNMKLRDIFSLISSIPDCICVSLYLVLII